uniref:Uncharacterized protein n=1 Tax=uncultured Thiotrichaceae bacterium TaxID=298394 RepID=A0A6S6U542_9GAMM|nr:MAG: Unknown protein [uncultured Thiotrichaceae bacterium]
MTQMRSECNVQGIRLSDAGIEDESIQLIFDGARRDLKLRQTAMIRHSINVDSGRLCEKNYKGEV